ncbi:heavy metal translocating P-type ATPase [Halopiger xanaduensis]|uniref:Heavy metal translocating P-type ATPase n=1 Tax=Halopiger xanaduensis (strain DSM 18323 / JCM 14033 / SH-6) TaxID=797210 RepID=F8DD23_HALXS|nr:cation-translocating P-type ATPase [Halopiger xanaduensis]AEH38498.1 heavy metal translocating P-type ATPase [Halopiger xanaduensis SH-6]
MASSSDVRADEPRCPLCGRPLPETVVAAEPDADEVDASAATDGDTYCSSGCREIDVALEAPAEADAGDAVRSDERHGDESEALENEDDLERTYFRVDGMHSATCESFLESVAEKREGVADAAASYVTEAVRVDYDPDRISKSDLRGALSTLGYTAYLREEATADDDAGATRRAREMSGLRKRRSEDFLEIQYVAGIVFGSFLLVPYAAVFYPMFLAAYSDWGPLRYYDTAFTGFDNLLFLPLFSVVTGVVLYLTGLPLLRGAYVSLKLRRPNTQLLAALTIVSAYVYGTASFFLGRTDLYYDLTIVVAALVMGAIFAEATVKRRATERLTDLTVSQVDTARVLESDGGTTDVSVADLEPDDRVLVREGERVPVDGVLVDGTCTVDEAVVTGESLPVAKESGDEVIGGSVVTDGAAVVDVGPATESSIEHLTEVVWNLQSAAHGVQRHADALAVRVAPLVLGAAVAVGAVQFLQIGDPATAALAALLTIMVASPWALGLATPASVAANIRDAMEQGIVVFDETVFERLRDVDTVVFDKTGTLTTGEMTVLEADAPDDLLAAAAALERRASHPAATAIAAAFGDAGGSDTDGDEAVRPDGGSSLSVRDFENHGTGVSGRIDGDRLLVGHPDLFRERGWELEDDFERRLEGARSAGNLPIVVGRNGRADGLVVVGDEPRDDWAKTVSSLHENGIEVVVLTGDERAATEFFSGHDAVDRVFAGVPPEGKTEAVRRLEREGCVAMVGDGTNDAPALAEADLGISLGSGTALASDASDLAIVEDDLSAVERAFRLAAAARRRVRRNLALALVYNAIAIPVAALGLLNPLFATAAVAVGALCIGANVSWPLLEE